MVVERVYGPILTPQEYLEAERRADVKHEYVNGCLYAMSGASLAHNDISANTLTSLRTQLTDRPCRALGSDMRVMVDATGLYTYPDVMIACEPIHLADQHFDILLNPTVLIEVLSPSTEAYDRNEKFAHYQKLESLTDYLLIAQEFMRIEHYRRQPNGDWLLHVAEAAEDEIILEGVGCRLRVADVYRRVNFETKDKALTRAPIVRPAE